MTAPGRAGDGYIGWEGREETDRPAGQLRSEIGVGSPRSSPETEPVARIASKRSPTFAVCWMSASGSLYRSRTMHLDWSSLK